MSQQKPASAGTWTLWRREALAGIVVGLAVIPSALPSALLAYRSLGPDYLAWGANAVLYSAVIGCTVVALLGTTRILIASPVVGPALVLASFVASLAQASPWDQHPDWVILALCACVFLCGLWQLLFAALRVAELIKFAPHPVMAGFINGIALLVLFSQVRPLLAAIDSGSALISRSGILLFMLALVVFIFLLPAIARRTGATWLTRTPATLVALGLGFMAYHAVVAAAPGIDLGGTIGRPVGSSHLALPVLTWSAEAAAAVAAVWSDLLFFSLAAVGVATLETLVAVRLAQNLVDRDARIGRELVAQGTANCLVSTVGGLTLSGVPSLTFLNFSNGGRMRASVLAVAAVVLSVGVIFAGVLSAIPIAALSAIMIATSFRLVDQWSLGLPGKILRSRSREVRARAVYELLVVVAVMGVTAFNSIISGMIVGCLLSGIIFIMRMGRPIALRTLWGDEVFSKRIRSAADMALLRGSGRKRVAVELRGVLFFANADHIGRTVRQLLQDADLVALDFKRVADIDVSAINVIRALEDRAKKLNKRLLLCNVAPGLLEIMRSLGSGDVAAEHAMSDLDSVLEWMEQQTLATHQREHGAPDTVPLAQIDFVRGLSADELQILADTMEKREFAPQTTLCREGEPGDRMWLLLRGTVSVCLNAPDRRRMRIASLGRGTTVGEMSLVETSVRSADIIADETVVCYELTRDAFDRVLLEHPTIGSRLLANLVKEIAGRLRRTSSELIAQA